MVTFPERKVTRRKGGTITTAHTDNGYSHRPECVRHTAIAASHGLVSSYMDRVISVISVIGVTRVTRMITARFNQPRQKTTNHPAPSIVL
jgi:hypothetical protein